jgi:tRNA1(Val) A37 N6-methylase TrmN6
MISCEYGQAVISVFIDLALAKIARKNAKMARLEHLIEIVNVDLFAVDLSKT